MAELLVSGNCKSGNIAHCRQKCDKAAIATLYGIAAVEKPILDSAQLRAGRALAQLSRPQLSELTGVSVRTLQDAEGNPQHIMRKSAQKIVREKLEALGVEFVDGGARLKKDDGR